MLQKYKTIYEGKDAEIVEKKSRFIAAVRPVYSEEEALDFIFLPELTAFFLMPHFIPLTP